MRSLFPCWLSAEGHSQLPEVTTFPGLWPSSLHLQSQQEKVKCFEALLLCQVHVSGPTGKGPLLRTPVIQDNSPKSGSPPLVPSAKSRLPGEVPDRFRPLKTAQPYGVVSAHHRLYACRLSSPLGGPGPLSRNFLYNSFTEI